MTGDQDLKKGEKTAPIRHNNIELAILFSVLAFAAFAVSDAWRKYVANIMGYNILDILFWQAVCGMVVIIILAPFMGGFATLIDRRNMKWQMIRGTLIALNTSFSLAAISQVPIVDAYTIFFLTPFMVCIWGVLIFKEPIGMYRILAILGGFIGGFVAFRPGFVDIDPAYGYAVVCVFTFSSANVLARYIGKTDGLLCFAFWPFVGLIVGVFLANGASVPPAHDLTFFLYMIMLGCAYASAMVLISKSYHHAPVAVIAPYQYVQIIFALFLGYVLFGDFPDMFKIIGGGIIVSSGLLLFARERHLKKIAQREGGVQVD